MFKRIVLIALIASGPVAANAGDFLTGMLVGGMMFGGSSSQSGGSATTILYSADEETIKATDPLEMRMVATKSCFNPDVRWDWDKTGFSLGELFTDITQKLPKKERQILQIARVFDPSTPQCAAIWFSYTEK